MPRLPSCSVIIFTRCVGSPQGHGFWMMRWAACGVEGRVWEDGWSWLMKKNNLLQFNNADARRFRSCVGFQTVYWLVTSASFTSSPYILLRINPRAHAHACSRSKSAAMYAVADENTPHTQLITTLDSSIKQGSSLTLSSPPTAWGTCCCLVRY